MIQGITGRVYRYLNDFYQENPDGSLDKLTQTVVDEFIEAGGQVIDLVGPSIVVILESFASAIIKGMQGGYNYARNQIRGKEDEAVTGIVITAITLGSLVYVFRTFRAKGD